MREVLDVAALDGEADFYGLGGDSLSAMELAVRLSDRFGVHLTAHDVLAASSADRLAALIVGEG